MPYLTALENVILAQHVHSLAGAGKARRAQEAVGLGERAGHLPTQLPGGEPRVCIVRALINDSAVILADEPTGNFDEGNQAAVPALPREAHAAGGPPSWSPTNPPPPPVWPAWGRPRYSNSRS